MNVLRPEWQAETPTFRLAFALSVLASLISVAFGLFEYPIIGHDAYVHLNWLDQFCNLRAQGIGYPRWLPQSFGGFGSPTFYFYPPLVYWAASFFYSLGLHSAEGLYQSIQLLADVGSLATCYYLLRQSESNKIRPLLGALIYTFLGYHFCDVYVRDALSEHVAFVFLPLLFLLPSEGGKSLLLYACGWVGLLLTNLPVAYIAIIALSLWSIEQRSMQGVWKRSVAFGIASLVSAVYLVPAFALRGLIHQRHLFDLPMNASQFGYAALDLLAGHVDWLRILSLATVIVGICTLTISWKELPTQWKWIVAATIFFQLPYLSKPLWHLIPGMSFVQFSWRWNIILLLAISYWVSKDTRTKSSGIVIALALVTLLAEVGLSRNLFIQPAPSIDSFRMDAPEYAPGWTSNDPSEVITIARRRMTDPMATLLGLSMPGDTVVLQKKLSDTTIFTASLSRITSVRFHLFFWPNWKLARDSMEIPLRPDPNGFAMASLPAGEYVLRLQLEKSRPEKIGATLSYIGLAVLLGLFAAVIVQQRAASKRLGDRKRRE
jgi:hypothetical protein